ncbi:unnamed protein product [Peniophora sp. CBMAI 1063]|nr:unnamed protein product [Peniophora sp. CBMAI 1063]
MTSRTPLGPKTALDTQTLSLPYTQASVTRTILSCAPRKPPSQPTTSSSPSPSAWFAYEIVYWSLDPARDKKEKPEFRVFEAFDGEAPEGLTRLNEELHFSARCEGRKARVLASKVPAAKRVEIGAEEGLEGEGEGEQERLDIAFIAHIPIKPSCLSQAKAFLIGPYAAAIHAESCTQHWYALQLDDTTLGLFGAWKGEEELRQHMEGGAVDMLDRGIEPFMSGPFDRRKGSMIAYKI